MRALAILLAALSALAAFLLRDSRSDTATTHYLVGLARVSSRERQPLTYWDSTAWIYIFDGRFARDTGNVLGRERERRAF